MNRTFAETPDSNIIKDELADVYERYTRLKAQSRDHYKKMKDLADKHQKYDGVARTVLPWITEAYQKLVSEVQEPVAAEPDIIQSQMETVKVLIILCTFLVAFNSIRGSRNKLILGLRD